MYLTMKFTMLSITIIFLMMMMIMLMNKKSNLNLQKSSPFECGFNPMSNKRLPFSVHFFLIAVLFLIFDIEVIIILPAILTMKSSMMLNWLLSSIMFIMILMIGTMHEWKNGMLNWTK